MDQDNSFKSIESRDIAKDFERIFEPLKDIIEEDQKEREDFIKSQKDQNLTFKLSSRRRWSVFFGALLVFQYLFLYRVIWVSLFLEDRPPEFIISALTVGTLSQTYLVIREIIKWIFTDIDGIDTDWKENVTHQKSHQKE